MEQGSSAEGIAASAAFLRALMVRDAPAAALGAAAEQPVVSSAASAPAVIDECVRRLREAGDGGESGLDKRVAPHVTFRTVGARPGSGFEPWRHANGEARGDAEWALPSEQQERSPCGKDRILFVHGGAYSWYRPSDEFYRPVTSRLAASTGLPVLAVDYRLAPAHKLPDPLADVLRALAWLWGHGPGGEPSAARTVTLVGDSAGGGLVLAACVAILAAAPDGGSGGGSGGGGGGGSGEVLHIGGCVLARPPLPTGVVAISPYCDIGATLPTYCTRAFDAATLRGDPVFSTGCAEAEVEADVRAAREGLSFLRCDADARDPLCSPMFAPPGVLRRLPPTLLLVGDAEVMVGEALELGARALEAGAAGVAVRVFPRMWHCFPFYSEGCGQGPEGTLKEAQAASSEMRNFIADLLQSGSSAHQSAEAVAVAARASEAIGQSGRCVSEINER